MIFERLLFGLLLVGASACGYAAIEEQPCPSSGTALTYETFGKPFLETHCQRCHGGAGPSREGAPAGYDFGTAESARAWRERIYARAASTNTTMPPGPDDPPEPERMNLAEWLACGAL